MLLWMVHRGRCPGAGKPILRLPFSPSPLLPFIPFIPFIPFPLLHPTTTPPADNGVVKKSDLPTKTCPVCQRPFAWRKKWRDCWDEVRYCSERCRRQRNAR